MMKRMMKLQIYGLSKPIFRYQTHFHPEKIAKSPPLASASRPQDGFDDVMLGSVSLLGI